MNPHHLTITTSIPGFDHVFEQRLLFGEAPDDAWMPGELQVVEALRDAGEITSPRAGVDVYSPEAATLVASAREFFGLARALGPLARSQYAETTLVLEVTSSRKAPPKALAESDVPPGASDG